MIKKILRMIFGEANYDVFYSEKENIGIQKIKNKIRVYGNRWVSSIHMEAFSLMENVCLENEIMEIELWECNITSRLISKIESIYLKLKKPLSITVNSEQVVLVKYLTSKYPIILNIR